jgi:hypothetical protein
MDHQVAMKSAHCCFASSLLAYLSTVVNVVSVFLGCFSHFSFILFLKNCLATFLSITFFLHTAQIFL